jgi:hypothetical protein
MIDIHPPHHAATTRREFFIHLSTVILGILIAIGLEQAVEAIHHAHERRVLIENFHHECAANLKVFDADLDIVHRNIAWARALRWPFCVTPRQTAATSPSQRCSQEN